jgi:hypothetical protein
MRHHALHTTGIGLLLGLAIALSAPTAAARSCRAVSPTPPSRQLREFRIDTFGLSLMIPDNYRSMLRSSGHITFHDPSNFELIQCLVRTGEYAEVPPHTSLEVHKGINPQSDLIQIVRVKRPWIDYYSPEYQLIEFAGRIGIQYEYTNKIYQLSITNISFLSDDGLALLTLTGPANDPIMRHALSQLVLEPQ